MTTHSRGTGQLQLIEGGRSAVGADTPGAGPRAGAGRSTRGAARSRTALDPRTRERGKRGVAQARAILEAVGRPSWSESEAS